MRYAVFALLLSACMSVSSTPNTVTPAPPVEIALSVPPATAFDRVMAAFVAEGYRVDQANREAGLVKSGGIMGDVVSVGGLAPVTMQPEHFFRATILPNGSGSRVLLNVTGRSNTITSRGNESTPETDMYECRQMNIPGGRSAYEACQQQAAKLKARIDKLAARIRGA